jgi:hypothetical protein
MCEGGFFREISSNALLYWFPGGSTQLLSTGNADEPFIPTFTPWEASISLETLTKSFLNPHNMHCRVLGVRSEQITGSPVSRKG